MKVHEKKHEKMGQLGAWDLGVATTKQKIPIWLFYTIRILLGCAVELHKHRDCKIWPCGTKFILFYSSYLANKCTSFYIKITTYYLPFKFESQNEDRWTNFAKIFIFVLSNRVFPMLLTENTTNDTCQSNLRGAWK